MTEQDFHLTAAGRSGEGAAEPEQPVGAPRFDDETIRRARPATPLSRLSKKTARPFVVVAFCLAAGMIVGVLAGLAAMRYYRESPAAPPNAANDRPENVAADASARPAPPPATTTVTDEKAPAPARTVNNNVRQIAREGGDPAGGRRTAGRNEEATVEKREEVVPPEAGGQTGAARDSLRGALDEWVAATNARDLKKQMAFYGGKVDAFYLARNASRDSVRQEKARVIGGAEKISIRADSPDIKISPDGRTATMLFRKQYEIRRGGREQAGAVLQELRWRRIGQDWKIVSERDVRVLN